MKLRESSLDHLIPSSVAELANSALFKVEVELNGFSANGRSPSVCVIVNGDIVWDNKVDKTTIITYQQNIDPAQGPVDLRIRYYGKNTSDTIVDNQGNIVENQCVKIKKILLNDVDTVHTQTLYQLGHYHMELPPEKKAYFLEHGFTVEPNHSREMYENGEWRLAIPMPVLSCLAGYMSLYEKHEVWIEPQEEVYKKIYKKFLNIRQLQQQIKELKCKLKPTQ